ncbi:disease resistance protein RPP8 [Gossypium hirsutum]|uniref:Disease resistance protein RPP8 n=2 Tax=Gossypium TaxID=3633 RepID=A0A1U8MCU4_GOSHI|nr:disease resistance protein RPP8-like [Gossypium hirsutum]
MAGAIVSLAVERISDLLIHEAVFLKDVKDQVESLKAELKRMECFLKDADRNPDQDERFCNRVSEIRDLAYDAEDVIDSFILECAHQGGFQGIVKRFTSIFTKPFHLHKIGVQVKVIQIKLKNISKSLPAYEISGEGEGSSSISRVQQRLRRTFSHVEEEDVISLGVSIKDVLAQLMTEDDRPHAVVSIVGMGGIGKTTLARTVYKHIYVRRHFDCLAWVSISQQCKPREVLLDVLMKVQHERASIDNLNENQLVKRLSNVLKEKQYLIVFDDIWRSEDWDILKPAFPRGKKGSKFLFTTRNKNVAIVADPCNSPIELPFLTDDESWKLFRSKAFPRNKIGSHACLEEFEKFGRQMVKKCGGLPLAIVVLGGLLATKHSLVQWEMVHRNIFNGHLRGFQHDHQYDAVHGILALSYNDLPYHLKPCFLYLSHYPEDWEISKKELIQLWIAEGFIPPSLESTEILMEDIGEQFLEELINRSLVQVVKRDYTGINVKTCRMHDLLRNLCIEKAREEKFLEIIQPPLTEFNVTLEKFMLRRIAIHPRKRHVSLKGEHLKLRSLLLFQNAELIKLHISECKNFKFLRVLNLVRRDVDKWHVSSEIGNLHHLRYLKMQGNQIILPHTIGQLKSLHTLYLQWGSKLVIPNVLFKLERLRHILLYARGSKSWMKEALQWRSRFCSNNVQTLKYIVVDRKLIENNMVLRLTNIQRLGLVFNRRKDVKPILMLLIKLHRLRSLYMEFYLGPISISSSDLELLSQCHHLSKLELRGEIKEDLCPSHHVSKFLPPTIVKLTLCSSKMIHDPMGVLKKLPCLRILRLRDNAYVGAKMVCSIHGFPQLDSLEMISLRELKEWEIEEGAMPRLRSLYFNDIYNLKMIPEGLRYITTLQELKLTDMRRSLEEKIQVKNGTKGEDFYKVRHIPSIQIRNSLFVRH